MLRHTDGQNMGICYNELLRLRDKYILNDLDRSNAFNLFGEIEGYYHDKRSFYGLGRYVNNKVWDVDAINELRNNPNWVIFDNCFYQEVTSKALAYIERNLKPLIEGYCTGYVLKCWEPLFKCWNFFLDDLLALFMFKECGAIYYHCEERCCFCVDTSQALKPLQLIRR